MTLTEMDKEIYQSTVSEFQPQITTDTCLSTAIKNVLDDFSDRKGIDGLSLSQSDINDLCGYREDMYCREEIIVEQLTHEISEYEYEVIEQTGDAMDFDRLQQIINTDDDSLPIVELDPDYFYGVIW